jgi:hypothetical protein
MDGGEKSERVIALALTDPECGKVFGSSESDDSAVLSLTRLSTHGHFGQPRDARHARSSSAFVFRRSSSTRLLFGPLPERPRHPKTVRVYETWRLPRSLCGFPSGAALALVHNNSLCFLDRRAELVRNLTKLIDPPLVIALTHDAWLCRYRRA